MTAPMDAARIRAFYDQLSPHFRRLWGPHLHDGYYTTGEESPAHAQTQLVEELIRLARLDDLPPNPTVLDIGCGMGATSVHLAQHLHAHVHGITLSSVQVDLARQLARDHGLQDRTHFEVADATTFEPPAPVHLAWMVGVLGHLPDQGAFLRRAGRLVQPGGRFVLADWTVPPDLDPHTHRTLVQPVLDGMLMPSAASVHDYTEWLHTAGFQVLETRDFTQPTLPTWDRGISIAQLPDVLSLARQLGADALNLLTAIRAMKTAMARGAMVYGVVIAQRR